VRAPNLYVLAKRGSGEEDRETFLGDEHEGRNWQSREVKFGRKERHDVKESHILQIKGEKIGSERFKGA